MKLCTLNSVEWLSTNILIININCSYCITYYPLFLFYKITTYFLTKKLPSLEERQLFALCVDSLLTEPLYLSVDDVDIACLWVFGQPRHTHYLACDSYHKFGSAIYDQVRYLKSEA